MLLPIANPAQLGLQRLSDVGHRELAYRGPVTQAQQYLHGFPEGRAVRVIEVVARKGRLEGLQVGLRPGDITALEIVLDAQGKDLTQRDPDLETKV